MSTSFPDRSRLAFAAHVFIGEMRRQYAALNPLQETPVRPLHEYPAPQREALLRGLAAAIGATRSETDPGFENWMKAREAGQS